VSWFVGWSVNLVSESVI